MGRIETTHCFSSGRNVGKENQFASDGTSCFLLALRTICPFSRSSEPSCQTREIRCCVHGGGHGNRHTHHISGAGTWQEGSEQTNKKKTTHHIFPHIWSQRWCFLQLTGQKCCFWGRQRSVYDNCGQAAVVSQSLTCCRSGRQYKHAWEDAHSAEGHLFMATPKKKIHHVSLLPPRPLAEHYKYNIIQLILHHFFFL